MGLRAAGYVLVAYLLAFSIVSGALLAQSFNVGANFTSMTYGSSTGEPPDTMGAAGPNHFIAFNNDGFSIFSKNGTLASNVSPTSFWTSALGSNPGGLTDPRILYDPASQRWFAVMITTDQTTNNKILFARSNTADPTQGFKGVAFTTSNNRFADFPTLGLDANGVYVGTNNFSAAGTLRTEGLYSVPKADLLEASPSLTRLKSFPTLSLGTVGFTLQPAVNFGPKLTTDREVLVALNNGTAGRYNFTPLTGTSGSGATVGSTTVKTVLSTSSPTNSAQPGSSTLLDNGDNNFSSNIVQMGNFLYWVHTITLSGRSAARWTIADATNFNIVQQGTISDPSLSYFFPSLAVNAAGDVVVGFSGSNSSTFGSTYAVAGNSAGGVPGGTLTFGSPVQTKAGSQYYDGNRWGDYSATTPDPADPGIFWTHQEYAAARQFSGTNWNWATEATEIIPTESGERRWSNTAGGNFAIGSNYFTGAAPVATDQVIFSRPVTSYTVAFSGANMSDRAFIRQGNVIWDLSIGSYTLTNASPSAPSLVVGQFQGTAGLTVSGGPLNTVNAAIGAAAVGTAAVTVGANATWTNSGSITVGATGLGTLTAQNLGKLSVGTNLSVGPFGTVNLNGGTIRFDGYSRTPGGIVSFTAGTVQVAGNRTIDTDAAIHDWFDAAPTIGVGKKLAVEGTGTISAATPVTLSGGTLTANSLQMSPGSHLSSNLSSQVMAPVHAANGSQIDVVGGDLTIGDATSVDGYYSNGTLHVGPGSVALADANAALLDSAAQVTLGAGANPGILLAANGITINAGANISGFGAIDTPNNVASPLANSGAVTGNSMADAITLAGYVTGTGSLDNVKLTGTFSPGAGPASVTLGSAEYDGSLDIELAGHTPGTEYDQINQTLAACAARIGGTLDVSLLNGFTPQAGDVFDFLTAVGGVSGTFGTVVLPALSGDLIWNIVYGPNSIELTVAAPSLPGDFDGNDVVDAADYLVWRKGFENNTYTLADFDIWRANFGQPSGNGSSVRTARTQLAVPEPAAAFLFLLALGAAPFCGRSKMALKRRPEVRHSGQFSAIVPVFWSRCCAVAKGGE